MWFDELVKNVSEGQAERRGRASPIYEELTKIREVLFDDESDPCAGMCNSWVRRPLNQRTSAKIGKGNAYAYWRCAGSEDAVVPRLAHVSEICLDH